MQAVTIFKEVADTSTVAAKLVSTEMIVSAMSVLLFVAPESKQLSWSATISSMSSVRVGGSSSSMGADPRLRSLTLRLGGVEPNHTVAH